MAMDAQTLDLLAETVKEAIAQAVEPLHARIKELESQPRYDDSELRGQIKTLLDPDVQDETFYDDIWWKLEKRVKEAQTELREMVKEIGAAVQLLKPYDDSALKSAFSEQGQRVSTVIDGVQAIKERIEQVAKDIPAAYDDSDVRQIIQEMDFDVAKNETRLKALEARPEPAAPRAGTDGRDALQLEVLPAIDEQKSYTRGTYAKHAGGLWRSFEQTSGLRGWECIVNGVKSVDARWDGKTLVETTTLSDGTVSEARKFFPVAVYKGVFDGGEYLEGDTATWAGSLWHCNVTATKAKPGDGSTDWTLAVKKGRDGKEVVVLPPAEPKPVRIGGS